MSQTPPPPPPPEGPEGGGQWGAPPPPPPGDWGPPPASGPGQWGAPAPGPAPGGPSGPRADFGTRFVAALIDVVIVGIVNFVLRVVLGAALGSILNLIIGAAYAIYFISSPSGQTIGMHLMNIRAIDAQTGGRVDVGKAVVRWLVAIVSGLACLIGYLWMLWDPEKQTWHDKAANTYVVPTSYAPVDKWPG